MESTPIDFAQAAYGQNKPAPANKQQGGNSNKRNMCGVAHGGRTTHSWAECFSNPINAGKKAEYFTKLNRGSRGQQGNNSKSILEAKLATSQALKNIYNKKKRPPTAASAMAQVDHILQYDNEEEQEKALIELAQALEDMSVNGSGHTSSYLVATAYNASLNSKPIIDSGASTTFVTSDDYLTNARKHQTPITTANGKKSFTKSSGKLKLNTIRHPIFLPALSAPDFNQNLISVGQLA